MSIKNLISLSTAGGGKTTRLIARINQILENGGDINKILVISFTNASCEDIYQRSGIKAETLHSFCYRFLPSEYTIEENTSRFTEIFLGQFFHLSQLGEITVNRLLAYYLIFQELLDNNIDLSPKDTILNNEFKQLVEIISIEKENHGCLFFSDIIHKFLNNLDSFLLDISSQYDHILIDEAQDLSEIQLQIVAKIISEIFMEDDKTFFIVGDVKQSIYDFQGSSPEIYLKFINELKDLCKNRNIYLEFEQNTKTYRFGGEILKKINEKFEEHQSSKNDGQYSKIMIDEPKDIEIIVEQIIEKNINNTNTREIMILFERNNKIVESLQNKFKDLGLNIKVYTQTNKLIEGLKDIVGFLQCKSNFYAAKILQGPFCYLNEPHFYFLNQYLKEDLTSYNTSFFAQLEALRFYPDLLIKYLISLKPKLTSIDAKLLSILYEISFSYNSIDSLVINIPETIKIHEPGIKFSTIHSSKGLEADIVIILPNFNRKDKLTINLKPFFFFFDDINNFTNNIINNNMINSNKNKNNLHYVALTRAKKHLYEIVINDLFESFN